MRFAQPFVLFPAIFCVACASVADAQEQPQASGYTLFNPAPDDQLRPLCTDRPGKGTSACTVDPGHVQIEIDAFDQSLDRQGPIDTTTTLIGSPTIKLGVTDTADIEMTLMPYLSERLHDRATGARVNISGFGDLMLHGKVLLSGNGDPWAVALDPFLKIPTADPGLGNGVVEGGLVIPLSYALSDVWSFGMTPEVDALRDAFGSGYHASLTNVAGVSRAFGPVTLEAEVWGDFDFDPAGTVDAWSFDVTGTWQPPAWRNFQIDGGVNFALNRNVPRIQYYMGISKLL
jgi:hypothetical protein